MDCRGELCDEFDAREEVVGIESAEVAILLASLLALLLWVLVCVFDGGEVEMSKFPFRRGLVWL